MSRFADLTEYASWDATELAAHIAAGTLSADEALDCSLAIIEVVDPQINAFVELEEEIARQAAADLGLGAEKRPLAGVPIAMKDCLGFVAGAKRYFGTRLSDGAKQPSDDEIVRRFRRLGLVPLGTTNVPELSSSITTESLLHGPCHNPWHVDHSTGGSGGGAAAAIACGAVPIAYGNDSAGSIRIPASCCGLFGLKPSRGRVPTGPEFSEVWFGLGVQHVITRSVRDSASVLDGVEGLETGALYSAPDKPGLYTDAVNQDPGPLRIAVSNGSSNGIQIDSDCAQALSEAAALLADLGHDVIERSPPFERAQMAEHIVTFLAVALADELPATAAASGRNVSSETVEHCHLALAERGRAMSATKLSAALEYRNATARNFGAFMSEVDVLLTPTLAKAPVPLGYLNTNQQDLDDYLHKKLTYGAFTPLANLSGAPSASVPLHWSPEGLPVGIMLTAAYGREDLLIGLSAQLERARPWQHRIPPMHIAQHHCTTKRPDLREEP
ncbi:MAG: amidase [Pseudomonadota bacterium]